MLLTQATTLDMIFKRFARKAAHCECLNQMQARMVLALKAQSRATVTACGQMCGQNANSAAIHTNVAKAFARDRQPSRHMMYNVQY